MFDRDAKILAALMKRTSSSRFPEYLKRALDKRHQFSTFLVLTYYRDRPPISHYNWLKNKELLDAYQTGYLSGAYLLDPYYEKSMRPFRAGFYRLRDIAPDRFYSSEYSRRYYAETQLVDEVGMLVKQSNGSVSAISISRDQSQGDFSRGEINDWRAISPVVTELLRQFGEQVIVPNDPSNTKDETSTGALIREFSAQFSNQKLTKREAEISALILQGHSSWSVSERLGISIGTVKVHRKNIYKKLKISSQAELFNILHQALSR